MTLNKSGYPSLAEMPSDELNVYSDVIAGIMYMFAASNMPEMIEHAKAINERITEEWMRRSNKKVSQDE